MFFGLGDGELSPVEVARIREKIARNVPLGPTGITLADQAAILAGEVGEDARNWLQGRLSAAQPLPRVTVKASPWLWGVGVLALVWLISDRG